MNAPSDEPGIQANEACTDPRAPRRLAAKRARETIHQVTSESLVKKEPASMLGQVNSGEAVDGTGRSIEPAEIEHLEDAERAMKKKTLSKMTKFGRYAGEITLEEIQAHFKYPSAEAATRMGVGLTVLKKLCRKFGIERWPYQKPSGHETDTKHGMLPSGVAGGRGATVGWGAGDARVHGAPVGYHDGPMGGGSSGMFAPGMPGVPHTPNLPPMPGFPAGGGVAPVLPMDVAGLWQHAAGQSGVPRDLYGVENTHNASYVQNPGLGNNMSPWGDGHAAAGVWGAPQVAEEQAARLIEQDRLSIQNLSKRVDGLKEMMGLIHDSLSMLTRIMQQRQTEEAPPEGIGTRRIHQTINVESIYQNKQGENRMPGETLTTRSEYDGTMPMVRPTHGIPNGETVASILDEMRALAQIRSKPMGDGQKIADTQGTPSGSDNG